MYDNQIREYYKKYTFLLIFSLTYLVIKAKIRCRQKIKFDISFADFYFYL